MKTLFSVILVLGFPVTAPSAVLRWGPFVVPEAFASARPPVLDPALTLEEGIQAQDTAGDIPAARKAFGKLLASPSAPEALRQEARRRLAMLPSPAPSGKPPGSARKTVSSDLPVDPGVRLSGKTPLTLEVNVPPEVNVVKGTVDLWGEAKPPEPRLGSWELPVSQEPLKPAGGPEKTAVPASVPAPAPGPDFENLKFTVADIRNLAMPEVSSADLMNAAYAGIARRLHPEALFIPENPPGEPEKPLTGVGMMLTGGEEITCREVIPGSSAAEAGVLPGTRILKIDGRSVFALGSSLEKVVHAIRGPGDSPVTLDLRFPDGTEKSLTLTRKAISLTPLICQPLEKNADLSPKWLIAPGILAVRLTSTEAGAASELVKRIQDPANQPVKALLLDLSDNGGGSTGEAARILQLLGNGGAFYTRREKAGLTKTFANPEIPASFPALPVAVLTSARTAASAEVIAAALQDQHRAKIIGQRTMGRSVVFSLVPVPGGSLQVPVAELGRADGRPIDRKPGMTPADAWGVTPDIEVPETALPVVGPQTIRLFDEPKRKEVPVPAEFGNTHPLYEADKTPKPLELTPPDLRPDTAPGTDTAPRDPSVLRALQTLHEQLDPK
ncbi:MAG: S41 family peptidase [Verrucomicrobiota bacterium]